MVILTRGVSTSTLPYDLQYFRTYSTHLNLQEGLEIQGEAGRTGSQGGARDLGISHLENLFIVPRIIDVFWHIRTA